MSGDRDPSALTGASRAAPPGAEGPPTPLSEAEAKALYRARRGRNIVIGGGLLLFVVLVFLVTIFRLGANVLERPI